MGNEEGSCCPNSFQNKVRYTLIKAAQSFHTNKSCLRARWEKTVIEGSTPRKKNSLLQCGIKSFQNKVGYTLRLDRLSTRTNHFCETVGRKIVIEESGGPLGHYHCKCVTFESRKRSEVLIVIIFANTAL
jgi:hypothetical protein